MSRKVQRYDTDYKLQAVALAKEKGISCAARELGVASSTLNGWVKASKEARLLKSKSENENGPSTLEEEVAALRNKVKEQDKEIKRLKRENDFLEEASAFFAASRLKSVKKPD